MRNTFSASLDHGQTPEGLRATAASSPPPLGSLPGVRSHAGPPPRGIFVFFIF